MRIIKTTSRNCDICGCSDLDEISSYSLKSRTRNDISVWNVRNVVCKNCGFAFVSPAPLQESLDEHYSDSFDLSTISTPDYSIDKRIKFIKSLLNSKKASSYLEIGSNNCPAFIDSLKLLFTNIHTLEINKSCQSSFSSSDEIPANSIEIVAAYFVLEHVPNPLAMLKTCAKIVSKDGFVIIEVPNLYLYPDDPAGLYLWEHVNHFSPTSLTTLAELAGLRLESLSSFLCSRPFGFVAAFKKNSEKNPTAAIFQNKTESVIAKKCMELGKEKLLIFDGKIKKAREMISSLGKQGKVAIIWAANGTCFRLLENFSLPETAFVIDSDPKKREFLPDIKALLPDEAIDKIKQASYLVINTPFYAKEIKSWIKSKTGIQFDNSNSIIIDYFD